MLIIISSAKTLDFQNKPIIAKGSNPEFAEITTSLLRICQSLSKDTLKNILELSDQLTELNYQRFQNFANAAEKQAIFAYHGDVYENMQISSLNAAQLDFLHSHLLIISGLYGALRPLDYIKPYRLEMATKLPAFHDKNLANFWQLTITNYINHTLEQHQNKYLINLASNEYSAAIDRASLKYPMINIHFKENKNGKLQTIGLNAKKARGSMVNFIAQHLIDSPDQLKHFSNLEYKFSLQNSTENELVFVRR